MGADAILGLGIQGVITYILILIMKNNHSKDMKQLEQAHEKEKQDIQVDIMRVESHKQDIDKLCSKIDLMIDTIHELQVKDTQKTVRLENGLDEVKDMYIRMSKKTDEIREKVDRIEIYTKMCPNTNKEEGEKTKWSILAKKNLELREQMQ